MAKQTKTYYFRCKERVLQKPGMEIQRGKWTKSSRVNVFLHANAKQLLHGLAHDQIFVVQAKGITQGSRTAQSLGLPRSIRIVREISWEQRHARYFAERCLEQIIPVWEHYEPEDRSVARIMKILRKVNDGRWYEETLGLAQSAAAKIKSITAPQPQALIADAIYRTVAADVR